MTAAQPIVFKYRFRFEDGSQRDFQIALDPITLQLINSAKTPPAWTALSHHKCPNCPLPDAPGARCPAAVSLVEIVELFGNACSYDQVDVTITSEARQYAKHTSLQQAVSSLTGLLMATSGCPIAGKLRPMVPFHLPFATDWETKYRVISMYLLAQFFIARRGSTPDWNLTGLAKIYEDLRQVNRHVSKRLNEAGSGDAHVNALFILDAFADIVSFSLDQRMLEDLEALFAPHLDRHA